MGIIDGEDGLRIDWRSIESHPGLPRYRMAAAGVVSRNAVLFIGGSENPVDIVSQPEQMNPISDPQIGRQMTQALLFVASPRDGDVDSGKPIHSTQQCRVVLYRVEVPDSHQQSTVGRLRYGMG